MSEPFELLLPDAPTEPSASWRWGTVTQVTPLRVRLDGEAAALAITPDSLVAVAVGNRVWCQLVGRRMVVLGKRVT